MDQLNQETGSRTNPLPLGNIVHSGVHRRLLIGIGVTVLLIAAVWIWKSVQVNNVRKQAIADRESLIRQARVQISETHQAHFKMLAKPLVWAIRNEMMQGNISQVNLYTNDLVKEKNIQRIVIANAEGKIISSTNKKDEGKPFVSVGKPVYLTSDSTIVESPNDSSVVMSSPIMGFNNRLGTVMITYSTRIISFK